MNDIAPMRQDAQAAVRSTNTEPVAFTALDIARNIDGLMDLGRTLLKSGLLPNVLKGPEAVVAVILKGQELGSPPMYALSNIAIVNGKPSISAEMMLALIYRRYGKRAIRIRETTGDRCVVEYRMTGWDDVLSHTFTIEEARKAQLTGKDVWKAYPAAMLRARCISAVARMAFPECIAGAYVPGELGDDVDVTPDGEVVSVSVSESVLQDRVVAEQAERVDSETGEIVESAEPDIDDRTRAMRHLHKWANEAGLSHADLHYAAQALFSRRNVQGLRELTASDIRQLMVGLERKHREDPVKLRAWLDSINPDTPVAREPDDTGAERGQSELVSADAGDRTPAAFR